MIRSWKLADTDMISLNGRILAFYAVSMPVALRVPVILHGGRFSSAAKVVGYVTGLDLTPLNEVQVLVDVEDHPILNGPPPRGLFYPSFQVGEMSSTLDEETGIISIEKCVLQSVVVGFDPEFDVPAVMEDGRWL